MKKIILLDGGLGQELIRRSAHKPHPLWSAKVMMDEPELVEGVHRDFIDAGARVISLNTYSATPERLERDASANLFEPLQRRAAEIAHRARDNSANGENVKIAGCIPPLYWSYKPEIAPDFDECLDRYRVIADIQSSAVDLIMCETMSSIKEGKAAAMAALETGLPTWLSFSIEDNDTCQLRSGEKLSDALDAVSELEIEAILINCSAPEAIDCAVDVLHRTGKPWGAYANGFTSVADIKVGVTVDALNARKDLGPEAYAAFALRWADAGASIVGGCCEVGPAHIEHLGCALQAHGYAITSHL